MGVLLADRTKAAKFLECFGYDVADLKSINQNVVRVSARNRMHPIHTGVVGKKVSGKNKMIQRFVQSDCLNALDDCLNGEQYRRSSFEYAFSSFIEIDGEEHDLLIMDATPTDHKLRPSHFQNVFRPNYESLDVIVITFSALDRGNFDSLEMNLEYDMCYFFGKSSDIQVPIILVGTETDFRNDSEA